jgi:hypothetical protein
LHIDIAHLVKSFRTADWISELETVVPSPPQLASTAWITSLLDNTKECLEKRRPGRAINWLALALRLNANEVVSRIRRAGLLRASKFQYQSDLLTRVVQTLLKSQAVISIPADGASYLESVGALLFVAPFVRQLYEDIRRELRKRRPVVLKSLVAVVDHRFIALRPPDRSRDSDDPLFYAAEEYADGLSLLVHIFSTDIGIEDENFNFMDEVGIRQGTYDDLLIRACKIKMYHEAELLVDAFHYCAKREERNVRIFSIDPRLEQSIRLGYIQAAFQTAITSRSLTRSDVQSLPSLRELVAMVSAALGATLITQVDKPIPRLVLKIPDTPEAFSPFREDHLYKEDVVYVEATAKEQFCRPEMLLRFGLTEGLTLLDVLKAQRLMNFLASLMAKRLGPLFETDAGIAFRSLLAVFSIETFRHLLEHCVSEVAARAFIKAIEYEGPRHVGMFDVQYQPVIRGRQYQLLPMNVLCSSNFMRNLLFVHNEKRKAQDPDSKISMQHTLYRALADRFEFVAEGVKCKVDGQHLEIDILAVVGNVLLVIECKSSFHPCSLHELRTSYDHMLTAADQLDRLKVVLGQERVIRPLLRKLKWNDVDYSAISTCIVTANRMFNGYSIRSHPVRQAYEMINVIDGGTMTFGDGGVLRVWRTEQFEASDLLEYLAGTTTHQDFFEAMEARELRYRLGTANLVFGTYILNGERLHQIARARYLSVHEGDSQTGAS